MWKYEKILTKQKEPEVGTEQAELSSNNGQIASHSEGTYKSLQKRIRFYLTVLTNYLSGYRR